MAKNDKSPLASDWPEPEPKDVPRSIDGNPIAEWALSPEERSQNPERPAEVKAVLKGPNLRFSVFFDGTRNNRYNTSLGRKGGTGSYGNDYSNISRLESLLVEGSPYYHHHKKLYIEGIGTEDGEADSKLGAALNFGPTGIAAKVEKALRAICAKIHQFKLRNIGLLTIDAFGFSRGAGAARYFVWQVIECKAITTFLGPQWFAPTIGTTEVGFVGLFDTVLSDGIKHSNDPVDFHVAAVAGAKRVVQLAAADEYRKNFALVDIATACKAGVGKQISIPGAHSDVGGGYMPVVDDVAIQVLDINRASDVPMKPGLYPWDASAIDQRFQRERDWLIAQGWFTDKELARNKNNELIGTRTGILNDYSRIPLGIMAHHAQQWGLSFDKAKLEEATSLAVPDFPQLTVADFPSSATVMNTAGLSSELIQSLLKLGGTGIPDRWILAFKQFAAGQDVTDSDVLRDLSLLTDLAALTVPKVVRWCEHMALVGLASKLGADGTGDWHDPLTLNVLRLLRHRYFHFSGVYGETTDELGMEPRFHPNIMDGVRMRLTV